MCALFFNGIIVNLYFWSWEKIDALNGRLDLEWVQELLLQFGPSIFFSYHVKNPGILRSRDCVCLVSLILQLYIYCPRQLKSVGYICILLLLYLSAQHEYWKSQKISLKVSRFWNKIVGSTSPKKRKNEFVFLSWRLGNTQNLILKFKF